MGWLEDGAAGPFVGALLGRLAGADKYTLMAIGAVAAALVVALLALRDWRRRKHLRAARLARLRATSLWWKELLRHRLDEPAALVGEGLPAGPAPGARAAFERDMEAAADGILLEANGSRAKAKALLRQRVNGEGAEKLNGSAALVWRQLGALSLIDSTRDALAAYGRAADLSPEDAEAQMQLGLLQLRVGNLEAAEAAFRRQIELGNGTDGARVCYRGRTLLGDVLAAKGDVAEALTAYAEAQREAATLLETVPSNAEIMRDLSVMHDRIGDEEAGRGQLDAALESYRASLKIAETLAARSPDNLGWQRDLSVSYDRIGDVLDRQQDFAGALRAYQSGLDIAERLARNGEDTQALWDLAVSLDRIGDTQIAMGQMENARKSYRRGLEIAERLVERDPANAAWQRDLAVSHFKLGSIEAEMGDAADARERLQRGRAIISRLDRIAAHRAQWQADLSRFDAALKTLPE